MECHICLDPLIDTKLYEYKKYINCMHIIHDDCYRELIENNYTQCSMCQVPYTINIPHTEDNIASSIKICTKLIYILLVFVRILLFLIIIALGLYYIFNLIII